MADKARKATDAELKRVERKIRQTYSAALKDAEKSYKAYIQKLDADGKPLFNAWKEAEKAGDAKEAAKLKKKYQQYLQSKTIADKNYKELVSNLSAEIARVDQIVNEAVNGVLPKIYKLNFQQLAGQIPAGYSYGVVNQQMLKNLALRKTNLVKTQAWNQKLINNEVMRGIINGESIDKISNRLTNVVTQNQNYSTRLARTAVTYAENQGRQDSYEQAAENGIVLEKVWIATNDARTRESHAEIDGEAVPIDEPFSNGLMEPGDPDGEPEEIYNCRCSMKAHVIGFRRTDGSIEYV